MDSVAQRMMDGLGFSPIPDLRNIPLGELARQADDGSSPIGDVEVRMVPDAAGQPIVSATMFSSAIR
jgi:hypothetical protein